MTNGNRRPGPSAPVAVRPSRSFLNDAGVRAVLFQILAMAMVIAVGWFLVDNTLYNLASRNIQTGFDYLTRESGFAIGETLIPYSATSTYATALWVGVLNTLKVSLIGIVFATLIGVVIGVARLSSNWLLARLATIYVESLRNVPVLLQLFFWYGLITEVLPSPRQAMQPIEGVFLSNRGFKMPVPADHAAWWAALVAFLVAVVIVRVLMIRANRIQERTGERPRTLLPGLGLLIGLPLVAWAVFGAPTALDTPALKGFNFVGGLSVSPEFAALTLGLTLYTAAFIAETVRSGIQAVGKGQWEAAAALGLKPGVTMRLIILPQALRVIVPPTTSQFLNLTKNSSLAVAIGYPDIVSVANTTLNQTGQAIENIALIMLAYLTVSLTISAFMNWYNKRIALVER
ncbi:amino acid ABC transporter permease [Tistrella bauzanensis]|uniref:Amino acid ABC transporter permease n=1 Tax=Tistrella arctica TaxID=3133430 RepID=A0ABU9YJ46_9PROT